MDHPNSKLLAGTCPQNDHLGPRNLIGLAYFAVALALTALALFLSATSYRTAWIVGQGLLAIVLVQWFSILHESGHRTLFRTPSLNLVVGHTAGLLALIPFDCWKLIHNRHHRWTGWQDRDVTTAALQPRELRAYERFVLNASWRLWIPFFATIYRLSNYWNLRRLTELFQRPRQRIRIIANIMIYVLVYVSILLWLGWWKTITLFGLGTYLTLVIQDLLILSQHTHIPMRLSEGHNVAPFSPAQQQEFTRSLLFPRWFSQFVLINIDAHELHHVFPRIPGYYLSRLDRNTPNAMAWWLWVWRAKRIRADVLLFRNRDQTGFVV